MKITTLFLLVSSLTIFAATTSNAQQSGSSATPDGQFGIGINVAGATIQYAITSTIQVGFTLNYWNTSYQGTSSSEHTLGPYVRFLFPNVVDPFVDAHLVLSNGQYDSNNGDNSTKLDVRVGLAYFLTPNIGGFVSTGIFQVALSSNTAGGFGIGNVVYGGAEWYFNR